ncbi:hypothetical protein HOS59_gp55 [Streptomyces phage Rowa]|uniref:Uncharacterized protein n=1 Tax=Streptomyces phage Rowa TaxID=2059883 RepID=A0A2H5BLW1_9CAUD|nr:hypothetical protein HOS59_gp55 [Streptomyces phage Rowa]AUG87319.1 hypothetical protein SEA_ROWA_55 [Streptomyces phage Rowa]
MITFVDLGPMPTVHLFLRVPVPLDAGGWTWGEHVRFPGVLAREFAYTADECESLVHTYGRTVTRIMSGPVLGERFMITARGPQTGMTLGMREWHYSEDLGDYKRVGEYMCGWREAIKALYLKTGELFVGKRFCPCTDVNNHGGLSVYRDESLLPAIPRQTIPYVRHKEDVPHEGALPDLYGLAGPSVKA